MHVYTLNKLRDNNVAFPGDLNCDVRATFRISFSWGLEMKDRIEMDIVGNKTKEQIGRR